MEKGLNISGIRKALGTEEQDIRNYSPLGLAYLGDAVFELVVRSVVMERSLISVEKLHKKVTGYTRASAQADMADAVLDMLDEEEQEYYRKGKNCKSHSAPKSSTSGEYHKATGFEAVLGMLFLKGKNERILELVKNGLKVMEEGEDNGSE